MVEDSKSNLPREEKGACQFGADQTKILLKVAKLLDNFSVFIQWYKLIDAILVD